MLAARHKILIITDNQRLGDLRLNVYMSREPTCTWALSNEPTRRQATMLHPGFSNSDTISIDNIDRYDKGHYRTDKRPDRHISISEYILLGRREGPGGGDFSLTYIANWLNKNISFHNDVQSQISNTFLCIMIWFLTSAHRPTHPHSSNISHHPFTHILIYLRVNSIKISSDIEEQNDNSDA